MINRGPGLTARHHLGSAVSRTIGQALVPVGRPAQPHSRIEGAESADHRVVNLSVVFDHGQPGRFKSR